jgi:putative glutamine amidotransferase
MSGPIVGLSTYREPASWGIWDQVPADLLPADYAEAVHSAGAIPMLLPVLPPRPALAKAVIAHLDALVIAGGSDVDPGRYGAPPHPRTGGTRPARDGWELALLDAAYARDLPVLGICRGMQLMAVAAGGDLVQDMADELGNPDHTRPDGTYADNQARTVPGSHVARLLGEQVDIRCHHHQAVRSHPGFRVTAYSGSVAEAIEDPAHPFRVAVQWHPEVCDHQALFAGLIAQISGTPLELRIVLLDHVGNGPDSG